MKNYFIVLLALALLAIPVVADGPETGVITGKVIDAQGGPLPGVTVTATGDRGAKSAITDTDGSYRFALLIPGDYLVKAELDGFTAAEGAASVSAGQKADVQLTMSMGVTDTITVTSEAPMVDKFNVTAGSTVSSEVGQEISGSTRTYYGVINTLPGVTSDSQNADIQGTRPSVNGASWADNNVFIDGVDTSFARFGGSRVFLPTTAVTEVTMESGGSSAEYGRSAGSTTNVVVKSGTNKFHADFLVQRQEVDWASDYDSHVELTQRESFAKPADFFKRTEFEKEGTSTGYETSIGGPLARDKAWFFLGWSDFDTNDLDKALNGDPVDVSLTNEARIAKLNFQPTQSHSLAFSYIDTPASRNYFNPESNDYWTPTPHVIDGTLGTLSWNYSISSNFFLETKIATQSSDENKFLACGTQVTADCLAQKQADRGPDGEGPLRFPENQAAGEHWPGNNYRVYIDTNNDSAWNNGWILDNGFGLNEFPRDQANFSITQFAGANHEFKYGVDWQEVGWESDVSRPGLYSGYNFDPLSPTGYASPGQLGQDTCGLARATNAGLGDIFGRGQLCLYRDYNADFLQPLKGSGNSLNEDLGIYLRDRFTAGDHWTFNLGLRFDDSQGENDIGRTVFDSTSVSPRIAITYDIQGDGKTLLSFNTGRYYSQLNQQWTNEHLQDQWGGYAEYDDFLFCDGLDAAVVAGCGGEIGYNFFLRRIAPGEMWAMVDAGVWESNIDPYYKDEVILGFERQVSTNWALDVKGIYWELGDMIGATIQQGVDGQQFRMTANYKDYPSILRAIDDARVAQGGPSLFQDGQLEGFEDGSKEYTSLQVQLNRRFANGWALYNNITWSELETTGAGAWWNNTNDSYGENLHVVLTQDNLDTCNQNQSDRNVPVDCNQLQPFIGTSASTTNRFGSDGLIDRPIIVNSFGFKTWTFGKHNLTAGGHFSYQSGTAWGRSEGVSILSLDGNTAQSSSIGLQVEERGARRLDGTHNLNLNLAYGFPLFNQVTGQFRVEILNVTDQQEQTFVTGRGDVRAVRRDFQRPQQARASFTVRF